MYQRQRRGMPCSPAAAIGFKDVETGDFGLAADPDIRQGGNGKNSLYFSIAIQIGFYLKGQYAVFDTMNKAFLFQVVRLYVKCMFIAKAQFELDITRYIDTIDIFQFRHIVLGKTIKGICQYYY